MSGTVPGFAQAHAEALGRLQQAPHDEAGLAEAYRLGRQALNDGVSVIDIALAHHAALATMVAEAPAEADAALVERAAGFLAECLSPFEMMLLGVRDANRRLMALNGELQRANAETQAAHKALQAETDERRRMEESLWQAQKLQATGRLAGGVAHHFNNLLTVVLGNLDVAARRVEADEATGRRISAATAAAERAAKVTQQLLSFSRRQILQPVAFEASSQLLDLVTLIGGSLSGAISIETDVPPELWGVVIDPTELELALLNLSINARDAMPNGGVLRISAANHSLKDARLGLDGDYLIIELTDTGVGIDPEVLPRIFDPFFTTKDVGLGTGLGLSQVHGFVHQSNGAVDVESEPGRGTTIRLYLPAFKPGAARGEAADTHGRMDSTVLVVDDDVDVAEVAASALEACGFSVKLAYRAQTALDLLRRGERVDLIFSDIVMPDGMNGIELAAEILSRYPDIPILLTTGYSDTLRQANTMGLKIVAKPYRPADLCNRISALLEDRPANDSQAALPSERPS